jgi:hypothetical protein
LAGNDLLWQPIEVVFSLLDCLGDGAGSDAKDGLRVQKSNWIASDNKIWHWEVKLFRWLILNTKTGWWFGT